MADGARNTKKSNVSRPPLTRDRGKRVRPTIRDVAKLAGVSVGTVSAAINNGAVAEETRQHVLRCVAELGFEPNSAARSLTKGRASAIGFVVPDLGNPFFAAVAEGVQRGAAERDVLLVLCITEAQVEQEEYYARVLRTKRLDGMIYLSGSGLPSPSLLEMARRGAMVFVDESLPGVDAPFIRAENRSGARAIAQEVLAAGHRRLAIIGGPPRLWTSEQRLAGYREAIAAAGLNPDTVPVVPGDYTEASGYAAATQLLAGAKNKRPTAILCANDLMAVGVIRRCRELGLQIPKDISLTGFDDIPSAELLDPALSTVAQPARAMGEAAARLLIHAIGGTTEPPETTEFATAVRLRHSIAAPPSSASSRRVAVAR